MRQSYVKDRHGAAGLARFQASASPELRGALAMATQTRGDGWLDMAQFVESTELVDRLFGRGDLALAWDIGRYAAEHNIGVWKSLLVRMLRPTTVLQIAAGLWSHHYDSGRLVTRAEGSNGVHVTIADFALPHRAHCLSIAGWSERTIELSQARNVTVREVSCRVRGAASCEYSLRWS
jgi:hypothetical protein